VLDVGGVDGEDDVDIAAEFLGDSRDDPHRPPLAFSLLLLNKLLIKIWFCEKRDNSL
jgi:hypothetical protein